MATSVLVDAGYIIALLAERDSCHAWAVEQVQRFGPPWRTCEAVISEAYYLLGTGGASALSTMLRRRALLVDFALNANIDPVLKLMEKYSNIPMSFADGCLVRMTETLSEPALLTTDTEFRIYRRLGRQMIPCVTPH